ncbi:MAG: 4-hydroxy-tetrahydrodipicolinate reductase [Deltaproteobacteria bacterium]|nr:4-hydroxy-tetrahydrodipicolinate reductase [Deltaproteobacteria bacterium]
MITVGIAGSQGKMGSALQSLLKEGFFPNLKCSALFDKSAPLSLSSAQSIDALIDFTEPKATMNFLPILKELKKAIVIGTTGFSEGEKNEIRKLSQSVPVVLSPNMSIGVNVLFDLVQKAAKLLPTEFSSHILEIHHPHKKDAPSGTALKLKEEILRSAQDDKKNVSIESVRGGDVVGEHTVYFLSQGERLELTHRATSRTIFARGALKAAEWVVKQKPGLYSMQDVLEGNLSK